MQTPFVAIPIHQNIIMFQKRSIKRFLLSCKEGVLVPVTPVTGRMWSLARAHYTVSEITSAHSLLHRKPPDGEKDSNNKNSSDNIHDKRKLTRTTHCSKRLTREILLQSSQEPMRQLLLLFLFYS